MLDTHVGLPIFNQQTERLPKSVRDLLEAEDGDFFISVASLWEIAIKVRLGKLDLAVELRALPVSCRRFGIGLLPISAAHALCELEVSPPTRDPFDRLLLAQCQCDGLRLVTLDRALAGHPLAARL